MKLSLTVTSNGAWNNADMAKLTAKYGPCEGKTRFGNVTLTSTSDDDQTTIYYFDISMDLIVPLSWGPPCYLTPDVMVGTATIDAAQLQAEGPGATMFLAAWSTPKGGYALPALSPAWTNAIRAAVEGLC